MESLKALTISTGVTLALIDKNEQPRQTKMWASWQPAVRTTNFLGHNLLLSKVHYLGGSCVLLLITKFTDFFSPKEPDQANDGSAKASEGHLIRRRGSRCKLFKTSL